ncbi:uncharacterized protein LOC126742257 isoform X2 [Anthonomus grandis grandis]|uniref:uncharacterized protein LOC126742257 isoform X2 n=1 Tax=Anthonomus grandis grandis TaxID=2921223 RepID=UPI002165F7A6|nr:uncharacterized protein LOC126742257 isoform X2 [Anthonomus grandis grandis]
MNNKKSVTMYESAFTGPWKKLFFVMFIVGSIILTVSYYDYAKVLKYQVFLNSVVAGQNFTSIDNNNFTSDDEERNKYLVYSSKCRIINYDPFSNDAKKYFSKRKYKSCTKHELLTYVTKKDNIATVHIKTELIPRYTKFNISCCYSDVHRIPTGKSPDNNIKITPCKEFTSNVTITGDAILIKCTQKGTKVKIYENVHASVTVTKNVQKKLENFDNSTNKPLSVLFIGIDSISRLNFIRALPNTHKYVEDHGWIPMNGYNKMDDNTFPNLMAILTGFNQTTAYSTCNPRSIGLLDKCPLLWYDFRNLGYVTAYAEDEVYISTFNYNKKGFFNPPADYYFRPYIMASEKLSKVTVSSMAYCTGPETAGERILNAAKDFAITFKEHPHFGFFWMNTFSHNDISTPSMMDDKLKSFLVDLETSGVTNNSIIIFISDHGMRFGGIRSTETGWLEERLPFIYFSFPPWFKDRFPRELTNFKNNQNRLTVPYDVHMTLQHILVLSGLNYTMKSSDACPNCLSLFEKVPEERSCEEAGITRHWCTCSGFVATKLDNRAKVKVANFFLDIINKRIANYTRLGANKCAKYKVEEVSTRLTPKATFRNASYALVILKTKPKAIFETTIWFQGDIAKSDLTAGDISRLDYYGPHTTCVDDSRLKFFCYCK